MQRNHRRLGTSRRCHGAARLAAAFAVHLAFTFRLVAASPGAIPPLDAANWIWSSETNSESALRKTFNLESAPTNATVFITADNGYELYVNGSLVGSEVGVEAEVWKSVERYDITSRLAKGRNVIGIQGLDLGGVRAVIAAGRIQCSNGAVLKFVTDDTWRATREGRGVDFAHPEFVEGLDWAEARVIGRNGVSPWGKVAWSAEMERAHAKKSPKIELTQPGADFVWPQAVAFIGEDCSAYVPQRGDAWGVVFRVNDWSRAYTEFDLPMPSKIGRKLYVLSFDSPAPRVSTNAANNSPRNARAGSTARLLFDAGSGAIGSPSVSFDGESMLVAMARAGEKFFHIYRIPVRSGEPQRLTDGTFHDIDPAELTDGRIVFTSTRIGTFEEYHQPPSRALFVMNADGTDIHPITHTLIFDNEAKVMADGRIAFIRTDNFFDRGKVETHLHVIRPDGTDGHTEAGADVGADYGVRLRILGYGSPAPLPDGRLAFISNRGNFISSVGSAERDFHRLPGPLGDLAALPDGRLLATVLRGAGRHPASDVIAVIDPRDNKLVPIHETRGVSMHSPVFVGARTKPPVIPDYVGAASDARRTKTGFLLCQDARFTKKAKADWQNIKAIRVLGGIPLTARSSHSHIVHVGNETVELGTVPLAPDGSFFVEVPADMPLALQAVDAEGRSELNEMSWIYVRPGERRSCVGCHQPRQSAPPLTAKNILALRAAPVKLLGQGDPHKFRGNNPGVTGMMDLQFERFRECASINLHNSTNANAVGRDEIAEAVQQLRSADTGLKISAAQRLALFRTPAAADALRQNLRDVNREVRLAAALALAPCGNSNSVASLIDTCADADPVVAQAALNALVNVTGGEVVKFDSFASLAARQAGAQQWREWFSRRDWTATERALIPLLRTNGIGPNPCRALILLRHIGSDSAREALRDFVSERAARNPYPRFERDNRTDNFTFGADSPLNPRALQEAVRSLGQTRDLQAVPLLAGLLSSNIEPSTANLFLAEACIEALGRIGTAEAESALFDAFARLKNYWEYVGWYSDHPALYACHSSPVHARIIEALDFLGSTNAARLVPALIRSVPTDPDRALFPFNDDYETLVGRVIRRNGRGGEVIETCLAMLGDSQSRASAEIKAAIETTHAAWGGKPGPENRASQILSLVCRDRSFEPRVRAAFERFVALPEEPIKRELGNPTWTPVRHWTLFYLARTLGNLGDGRSVESLVAVLGDELNEARHGRPDPSTPQIHFLHNEYTPCWRAAAAWALGETRDSRAVARLLATIRNFDNATDVRHSAARALERIAEPASLAELKRLAADYPEISTRRALNAACEAIERRANAPTKRERGG
jgi:HEAT repeat protein